MKAPGIYTNAMLCSDTVVGLGSSVGLNAMSVVFYICFFLWKDFVIYFMGNEKGNILMKGS